MSIGWIKLLIPFHLVSMAQAPTKGRKEHQNEQSIIMSKIRKTNWLNFGPTNLVYKSQPLISSGQYRLNICQRLRSGSNYQASR